MTLDNRIVNGTTICQKTVGYVFSSYSATHHQNWLCFACSILSWSGRILQRPSLHFPLWCCWQQQRQIGGSAHNCILLQATLLMTTIRSFKTQLNHSREYSLITVFQATLNIELENASWLCGRGWSDRPALQYFALACIADTAAARRCRRGESCRIADLVKNYIQFNTQSIPWPPVVHRQFCLINNLQSRVHPFPSTRKYTVNRQKK